MSKYLILVGKKVWISSIVYFPVEVTVLDVDLLNGMALVINEQQKGWVEFSRIYKTEEECPQR